jgi:hypothetical protein
MPGEQTLSATQSSKFVGNAQHSGVDFDQRLVLHRQNKSIEIGFDFSVDIIITPNVGIAIMHELNSRI